jgi:hypothetical protein
MDLSKCQLYKQGAEVSLNIQTVVHVCVVLNFKLIKIILYLGSTVYWVLSGTACNDKGEVLQKIPVRKFQLSSCISKLHTYIQCCGSGTAFILFGWFWIQKGKNDPQN